MASLKTHGEIRNTWRDKKIFEINHVIVRRPSTLLATINVTVWPQQCAVRLLIFSDLSLHRTKDLLGIEAHTLLKHPFDLPDVFDILGNITIDDHKVGRLADFDGADLIFQSKRLRAIVRRDTDRLYRAKPRIRQQFNGLL